MLFGCKKKRADPQAELSLIPDAPLDSLTILIPFKGEASQLAALLSYFSTMEVHYPVMLLLSGNRATCLPGEYPNLNLQVFEFSEDTPFFSKLREGIKQLKTPLVAMCAADDVSLSDAIKKAGGFLWQNPEYSACHGYNVKFSEEAEAIKLLRIDNFTPSIDADDPLMRLNALMRRYQPVCWAVFRTQTMQAISDNFTPDLNFMFNEFLWSGIAALTGKIKRLPMIYCLRRKDTLHLMGHPLYAMLESPQKFFSEYLAYRDKLLAFLRPASTLDQTSLERTVDLIHACHFSREMLPSTFNYFTDHVLANPTTSIHDPAINAPMISQPSPGKCAKEIRRDHRVYRAFPAFLNPEPIAEIHLPRNFVRKLIGDIKPYFG
ncbi:MAG: TIGR00180 family glycosyltransferase [Alphaproteobacteria bacterium]|nr:TIGR00180 family glycosyltransferase [Alphaproteobacteria bacterium]